MILVNFADKEFVTPDAQNAFWRLLNEPGYSENGATGSAIDYFKACSQGQFVPEFDVVGPYTLEHDMEYYGGNIRGQDRRPSQMALDACWAAHNNGIDFSQYDTDNDVNMIRTMMDLLTTYSSITRAIMKQKVPLPIQYGHTAM